MKILVVGAGAVGSYYGGRLALAGHEVTLIGRRPHVQAIREHGLTINSKITGRHNIRIPAVESLFASKAPDLLLLCVKCYDTDRTARALTDFIGPQTLVLCFQNGIENHEIAGCVLGASRVHPAVIYVGVRISEPGTVEHVSRGEVILPAEISVLCPTFQKAGIPAKASENIIGLLWNKLLLNAGCNVLGMICGASFGELAANSDAREVIRGVVAEVVRLAQVRGVRIPGDDLPEEVLRTAEGLAAGLPSMLQDYRAGKSIEIDALNGVVVRMGKECGIPTPYNTTLYAAGKLIEGRLRKRE